MLRRTERSAVMVVLVMLLVVSVSRAQAAQSVDVGRSWPRAIVVDQNTNVIYVNTLSGEYPPIGFTLTTINATDNSVMKTLPFNGIPGDMAIDDRTGRVFAVSSDSVLIFDPKQDNFTKSVDLGKGLYGIAVDSSKGIVFVTSEETLFAINETTESVVGQVPIPGLAQGLAVDNVTGRVYVTNFLSGGLTVIDERTLAVLAQIQLTGTNPSAAVVNDRSNVVYVTTGKSFIVALSGATDRVSARFAVSSSDQNGTFAMAIDQNLNAVFVATEPGHVINEIDGSTGRVLNTYQLDYVAFEMAIDQKTNYLYITNYHQVSVIQIVGNGPFDAILVAGIVATVAIVLVGAVLLLRRKTRRNSTNFTASGERQDVLLSLQRRDQSWLL